MVLDLLWSIRRYYWLHVSRLSRISRDKHNWIRVIMECSCQNDSFVMENSMNHQNGLSLTSISLSTKCQLSIVNIRARVMLWSRNFPRWSWSGLARFQTELGLATRPCASSSSGSDRFQGHPSDSSRARTGLHAQPGSATVTSRSSRAGTGQTRPGAREPGISAGHGARGAERRGGAQTEMGRGKTGRASG